MTMKAYADYEYYRDSFLGNSIPEEAFPKMASEASAFIREITQNRIDGENVTEEVKDAVCAVCEAVQQEIERFSKTDGREVKSENTDGYQISYVTEGQDGKSREEILWQKKYQAARQYLLHTGLLYRGCDG